MIKNKMAIIAVAGMLAMCVGLTACGNNASSSSASSSAASSSASSSAASSSASSSAASSAIAYWQGELSDGSIVTYFDDGTRGIAALAVAKSDLSDGTAWVGSSTSNSDGTVTVTDAETKKTISYTISDVSTTSLKIDLEGYGEVELKPVTEAEIQAYAEELSAAVAVEGQKLMAQLQAAGKKLENEVAAATKKFESEYASLDDSTVLFWSGTPANGMTAYYMDDPQSKTAFLSVVKDDLSDGAIAYGKYTTSDDGKTVTITDAETGKAVVCEILEENAGNSLKVSINGYGEIDFAPVTKADFTKYTEELSKQANATL